MQTNLPTDELQEILNTIITVFISILNQFIGIDGGTGVIWAVLIVFMDDANVRTAIFILAIMIPVIVMLRRSNNEVGGFRI